jgi:hypothetical protein
MSKLIIEGRIPSGTLPKSVFTLLIVTQGLGSRDSIVGPAVFHTRKLAFSEVCSYTFFTIINDSELSQRVSIDADGLGLEFPRENATWSDYRDFDLSEIFDDFDTNEQLILVTWFFGLRADMLYKIDEHFFSARE